MGAAQRQGVHVVVRCGKGPSPRARARAPPVQHLLHGGYKPYITSGSGVGFVIAKHLVVSLKLQHYLYYFPHMSPKLQLVSLVGLVYTGELCFSNIEK